MGLVRIEWPEIVMMKAVSTNFQKSHRGVIDPKRLQKVIRWLIRIARAEGLHLVSLIQGIDLMVYYMGRHSCREYTAVALICLSIAVKFHEPNDGTDYVWNAVENSKVLKNKYSIGFLKRLELHVLDSIAWHIWNFNDMYSYFYDGLELIVRRMRDSHNRLSITQKMVSEWETEIKHWFYTIIYHCADILRWPPHLRTSAICDMVMGLIPEKVTESEWDHILEIQDVLKHLEEKCMKKVHYGFL